MPKVDLVAELAQKLLHTLEQQRQTGSDYPLTVARLATLADPLATSEQVSKALAKKPFAAKWIVANKKDPNSPLALAEDTERLAASPLLLEYTLGLVCSADKPVHPPTKAVGKVEKALKPAFKAALERQIAEQTLSPSVGMIMVRNKPQLYLQQFPPPPPKKKPAEELSEKLVQVLSEQREQAADSYPTPLDRLIERTGLAATSTAIKAALKLDPFARQALQAMPKQADSLVALAADRERLASSPALLHRALTATRTMDTQAVTVAELRKKINASLQDPFIAFVNRCLTDGGLPDGVGVLRIKKKPLLFLLADLNAGPTPTTTMPPRMIAPPVEPESVPPPLVVDFGQRFDAAFARLDHEHGSHNHVSLVALRRAMPVDRAAFDAELQQLRRSGRYSLSAAEGRHGISAEEQDAGIREDGSLLLFVSRREA